MVFKKCSELESHLNIGEHATFAEILKLMTDLKETGRRNSSVLTERIVTVHP